ncbi:collagen alpha-2(VIII) chain-like [Ruditapes philippinarum]|uniref:collagen alpha-2(VIII) chain-like n=1 Tax=Ruditapes philippinarum TaxID=129788 RepID=UPI00295AA73F|nr:collagen alpha-2(VIII) chain-like [Ruditapes philippinarum]
MVNEIKKTEDNVISTLGDIKQTVDDFTDMFADMRGNIMDEMFKKGGEIKRREGTIIVATRLKKRNLFNSKKTYTDEETGCDTSTGLFTAPVGVLYQFSVHTCARHNNYAYLGLMLEGNVIAADANYGDASNNFGAIIRVKSGEQVCVKSASSSSNRQLVQDRYKMNTFSGVLVNN